MTVRILTGDCRDVLATLDAASVDAVVTDPPYGLGFMGKDWDHEVPGVAFWEAMYRVMKPGAHLLAFGGTRTFHRIAVAIEDAGFEIRDTLMWLYSQGFPKSHDVSKAIDKVNGEGDRAIRFTRWMRDTNLTRSRATDVLRDAGLISENGTMAGHFFASSQAGQPAIPTAAIWAALRPHIDADIPAWVDELIDRVEAEREVIGQKKAGIATPGDVDRYTVGGSRAVDVDITAPATPEAARWAGWGTALKPAYEPIILARKPLAGTVAANVLAHGTGALNIDACRIPGDVPSVPQPSFNSPTGQVYGFKSGEGRNGEMSQASGRWPANVILDEEAAEALDAQSGERKSGGDNGKPRAYHGDVYNTRTGQDNATHYGDTGGASRFFKVVPQDDLPINQPGASRFQYVAKASRAERRRGLPDDMEANHPTVKPLALMRYLITLITPPGGVVLDPFMGSGSTGVACLREGVNFIGIELDEEYAEIARRRITGDAPLFASVEIVGG